jgi:hypothetical protein
MNRTLFSLLLISLLHFPGYSQDKKDLPGTWYGKIGPYPLRQDGTAQCYTKKEMINWQQKLTIDKKLNYVYTEYYKGHTLKTYGRVFFASDTLKFLMTHTNQPELNGAPFESSFFLYALSDSMLIYSNSPVKKIIKDESPEEKIFQKVEVSAEYSSGNDEFLKSLYRSLVINVAGNKDSVSANSYKVKIDQLGKVDLSTLIPVNAEAAYFDAIRQGLLNLGNNFKPAMQNGRPVTAYMSFRITY